MGRQLWRHLWREWRIKRALALNASIHARLQGNNARAYEFIDRHGIEAIALPRLSKIHAVLTHNGAKRRMWTSCCFT